MSYIVDIKDAIRKLDAGPFQNLCDNFLREIGYKNIVGLGSQPGTNKTTFGTPDTYYCFDDNNKYIFIEYTTQQDSIYRKISEDIQKCLDEDYTHISHDKISEIFYFHTTSNITSQQDNELKALCESKGILLKVWGIDYFANKLYDDHKYLVKQHLHISIATQQILPYNDFISSYNSAKTAAPIDTEFKFRNEEIDNILESLKDNYAVLLCGDAGVGKTRLALECCKRYSEQNNYKILCIRNNAQPIYDDLYLFFRKSDKYIILIDDANELSELETIIRFFVETKDLDFKIILTVRNYAAEIVNITLKSFLNLKVQQISPLKDNEIEELIKNEFGIKNPEFLNRIIKISEGNARIAFLAGKIAVESNTLESIEDVTDIYASYYGKFLSGINLNERNLLSAAAILSFIGPIRLDSLDKIYDTLCAYNITAEEYKKSLYQLHSYEIVDIYRDKAVKFSDQCLSNYLLYYVFIEKRWLKLSDIIRYTFKLNQTQTIYSMNILINLFINQDNQDYLFSEIKELWNKLKTEDSIFFWEYVKVFYAANPIEALLLIRNKITDTSKMDLKPEYLIVDDRYNSVTDDILNILGGFANTKELDAVLDLYFIYFEKRPDMFNQFYYIVVNKYGINIECYKFNFYTPIKFIEKLVTKINSTQNQSFIKLFVYVAKYYLKTHFDGVENKRGNVVSIFQFDLQNYIDVLKYRDIIWNMLIELYSKNAEKEFIEDVLYNFGNEFSKASNEIIQNDFRHIINLISMVDNKNTYYFCSIINNIIHLCKDADIEYDSDLNEYINSETFKMFQIFNRLDDDYSDLKWDEKNDFFKMIVFISDTNVSKCHDFNNAVNYIFESVFNNTDYYMEAVKRFLGTSNQLSLNPYQQLNLMFQKYSDVEIWDMISEFPDQCRNTWQYCYFTTLPVEFIDERKLKLWYDFLKNDSDKYILSSFNRDLLFLKRFQNLDEDVIVKSCKIIDTKRNYSDFIVKLYFDLLFNTLPQNVEEVVEAFNGHYEFLCELYLTNLSLQNHCDHKGLFLKAIYEKYPNILNLLFSQYYKSKSFLRCEDTTRLNRLFELDGYIEIFDCIMDIILHIQEERYLFSDDEILGILSNGAVDKQYADRTDIWIKHYISTYSNDKLKISLLF